MNSFLKQIKKKLFVTSIYSIVNYHCGKKRNLQSIVFTFSMKKINKKHRIQ